MTHYARLIFKFFDKLEDHIRGTLSHVPIIYSFIGGASVVLFWRAVWHTADVAESTGGFLGWLFTPEVQLLITSTVLLLTGVMVSTFIGDRIILSGLKHEKKIEEKTEAEVRDEKTMLARIEKRLEDIEQKVSVMHTESKEFHKVK